MLKCKILLAWFLPYAWPNRSVDQVLLSYPGVSESLSRTKKRTAVGCCYEKSLRQWIQAFRTASRVCAAEVGLKGEKQESSKKLRFLHILDEKRF